MSSPAVPLSELSEPPAGRRWWALAVVALAQLMVVLDGTIVNIALPRAQLALGISDNAKAWVVTSYALAFGSLLLLGGRVADHWGRKRTFITGMLGFAAASGLGGAAQHTWELFAARSLQGVFAALLAPAALSLLTVAFPGGRDRNTAFAVFGAIGGGGAAVGLVLGGVLTEYTSWRWCLLVNIPVSLVAVGAALPLVNESRRTGTGRMDWPGAGLIVTGLGSLVYGLTQVAQGWKHVVGPVFLGAGGLLLLAFILVERKVSHPLLPLRIPINRNRGPAFLFAMITAGALSGALLQLTFYYQGVLHYSPITAGLAFLPLTAGIFTSAPNAARVLPRVGPRVLLVVGPVLASGSLFWLAGITAEGPFLGRLLPGLYLLGVGLGMTGAPLQNIALHGVDAQHSGVASALVNATQQVGGSIGTALLATVAVSATAAFLPADLTRPADALVAGYSATFFWAGVLVATIVPLGLLLVRTPRSQFGDSHVPPAGS